MPDTDRRSFLKAVGGLAGSGAVPGASADDTRTDTDEDNEEPKRHQLVYWQPDGYTVPMAGFDVLQETIDRKLSGFDGCGGAKLCRQVGGQDEETYAVWVNVADCETREQALELREVTNRLLTHLENRYTIK